MELFFKVRLFYNTRKDLAFQYYRNLIIDFLIGDFLNPGNILFPFWGVFRHPGCMMYYVANPNKEHVSAVIVHRA